MQDQDQLKAPLDPYEALMSIRAILDATVDRSSSMPMEAALRLIEAVLCKALPFFRPYEAPPADDTPSSR
jgi:hypothetical protein